MDSVARKTQSREVGPIGVAFFVRLVRMILRKARALKLMPLPVA